MARQKAVKRFSDEQLDEWLKGRRTPPANGRVIPFGEKAALFWARLMAQGTATGRSRNPLDMIVAAVAEANDCVVVTDNARDFAGIRFVNPVRGG